MNLLGGKDGFKFRWNSYHTILPHCHVCALMSFSGRMLSNPIQDAYAVSIFIE